MRIGKSMLINDYAFSNEDYVSRR